jgi:sodium-dependent dicarboxylate transporter 2/3/5
LRIKPWGLNCAIDSRSARKILPARSNTIEALPATVIMTSRDSPQFSAEWTAGRLLRLFVPVALAGLLWLVLPGEKNLRIGMAIFALISGLWVSQGLPLAVTALAVPLLACLSGLQVPRQALASFANPVIFLFLGGFALAAALSRQGLDRALAQAVMRLAGGRLFLAVLILSSVTLLLSMWISNTASVAMMIPLAIGLLGNGRLDSRPGPQEKAFTLLAIAYSASIGGIGTLVGSPPNAIAAAQAGITFSQWLTLGLPLVAALWPLMLVVLFLVLRPRFGGRAEMIYEPTQWTRARTLTVVIFFLTILAWVFSAPLARELGIASDMDTVISLGTIVLLVACRVFEWRDLEHPTQWEMLLLFGGGLALSDVMASSGGSRFLAELLLVNLQGVSPGLLLLALLAFVVFLTELVSNTASTALLLPIFLPVAAAFGLPPITASAAVAIASSCAFMLPVATPPNAIVFATGAVPQSTMLRCGLWLNFVCIAIIAVMVAWGWR